MVNDSACLRSCPALAPCRNGAGDPQPPDLGPVGPNVMALDQQSGTIQPLGVATEVGRAPQTQTRRKRQSWMVQLYIRLLTGSVPGSNPGRGAPELEVGSPWANRPPRKVVEPPDCTPVGFQGSNPGCEFVNSKSPSSDLPASL